MNETTDPPEQQDRETPLYEYFEEDEPGGELEPPAIPPLTEAQMYGRTNLFKLISLAMANTDEPLSNEEHDELVSLHTRVFNVDELPLKYLKWIRRAQLRLYDRLEREGVSLQDYYFQTQFGPVGVPSVDDYES